MLSDHRPLFDLRLCTGPLERRDPAAVATS
jgi:hypothetical protein